MRAPTARRACSRSSMAALHFWHSSSALELRLVLRNAPCAVVAVAPSRRNVARGGVGNTAEPQQRMIAPARLLIHTATRPRRCRARRKVTSGRRAGVTQVRARATAGEGHEDEVGRGGGGGDGGARATRPRATRTCRAGRVRAGVVEARPDAGASENRSPLRPLKDDPRSGGKSRSLSDETAIWPPHMRTRRSSRKEISGRATSLCKRNRVLLPAGSVAVALAAERRRSHCLPLARRRSHHQACRPELAWRVAPECRAGLEQRQCARAAGNRATGLDTGS